MKIMVVGPDEPDLFADNVAWALRSDGHVVHVSGPVRQVRTRGKLGAVHSTVLDKVSRLDTSSQRHLVAAADDFGPDLVLTVDKRMRPATVRELARYAPVVLWFPDAVSSLGRHEAFVAGYERIYFKNPLLVDQLVRIHGLPVRYLPEAANPGWHRPDVDYGTTPQIVLAGNLHPTRVILLDRLLQAGVPLAIYGSALPSWLDFPRVAQAHTERFVSRHEKAEVFRSARGVLNNLHPAEFAGANCRLFEATASGGATLTEWRPGMDELFTRDVEALSFDSFDRLLDLCHRLLEDETFGRHIADAGAKRSAAEHTYGHRLGEMLDDLGMA